MAGFSGHNLAFAFGLLPSLIFFLLSLFNSACNIISFFVFLSPLPTFYQIYKKKSTEGFQSVPYVVALFSAMLLMYYAFLKTNATLLITINSFGCFIETVYIALYLYYSPKKAPTVKLLGLTIGGFGLILVLTHFLLAASLQVRIVGWICLVFSVSVFASPLGIVKQVIRTKSVEFMPFFLSFSLTLNAVMWFFYGFLIKDFNIAIPNILGFGFGIIQMVLYVMYKDAKKVVDEEKPKLPELEKVMEEKLPIDLAEQMTQVGKLTALSSPPEKVPVVPPPPVVWDGLAGDLHVPRPSMEIPVAV